MPNLRQRFLAATRPAWLSPPSQLGRSRSVAEKSNLTNALSNSVSPLFGGYTNPVSGAGTFRDKSIWGRFTPTTQLSRRVLETIAFESWAAGKFITIPARDSSVRWRSYSPENDGLVDTMKKAEKRHLIRSKVAEAHRLARLMGTSLMIPITREAPLSEPLDMRKIKKGDLKDILIFDRYQARILEYDPDLYGGNYGKPLMYEIDLRGGVTLQVHGTRALRIDGLRLGAANQENSVYEQDWGVSELVPVMFEILRDNGLVSAISNLTDEASIGVMKMRHFKESLMGENDPDIADPLTTLMSGAHTKSVYRTILMDKDDEFLRIATSFAGLPDLMDKFAYRLAAAADIPATKFWSQSPEGMNATGESDDKNYAMTISSIQRDKLDPVMTVLDQILAKDAGTEEPPPYEWNSITVLSELDIAEAAFKKTQALASANNQRFIDMAEGRKALNGDALFGNLDGSPDFGLFDIGAQAAINPAGNNVGQNVGRP